MINIPQNLAKGHGGKDAEAIGAKWAETFAVVGGLKGDHAVLDIGCGPGRMALAIGERFGWSNSYSGFDIRKKDIAFCSGSITAAHPAFHFAHIDAYNGQYNPTGSLQPHEAAFPVPPQAFDFAFATSVFTHMFRREVEHYARETFKALKPGGSFLCTWFILPERGITSRSSRFSFSHPREDGTAIQDPANPEEAVAYAARDVLAILKAAGFGDIAVHKGGWSGDKSARHSQDFVVAHKPLR